MTNIEWMIIGFSIGMIIGYAGVSVVMRALHAREDIYPK